MAGDSFEFDVNVRADSAAAAAVQVERLAQHLEIAESAAKKAAEAVSAGEAAYKATETAADGAAKALEKINLKVEEQRDKVAKLAAGQDGINGAAYKKAEAALQQFTQRQAEAAARVQATKAALSAEAASLDKLKTSADAAAARVKKIESAQASAKGKAEAFKLAQEKAFGSGDTDKAGKALGKLGGPLGQLADFAFGAGDEIAKLKESLGTAGPYAAIAVAIVGIATAVATVTAAALAGVAAVTKWAVGLSDAARTQRLLAAGVAGSVLGGQALDRTIDRMANNTVPQSRDELLGMAADLKKAGFEGAALAAELEKTAIKAAEAKFGPDWRAQLISIDNSTARLKKNFSALFSGLKIEKLLEGLSRLVDLFDKTNVTGRAIKVVFESLFQPIINGIVDFIPKMESAFIQFQILVLKGLIAIKPFGSQIKEVAIAFGILAGIVALMAAGFTVAVIAPFAAIVAIGVGVVLTIMQVIDSFVSLWNQLNSMSLGEIGTAMIQGLIDGIVGGGQAVISAITGVVGGAVNAAKAALGIASPSKVFAEIGTNTAAGMAGGVEEGTKDTQAAIENLVAPPTDAGAPAAASGGAGGNVFNVTVNANGGDGQSIAAAVVEALEGLMAQGGRAVPA